MAVFGRLRSRFGSAVVLSLASCVVAGCGGGSGDGGGTMNLVIPSAAAGTDGTTGGVFSNELVSQELYRVADLGGLQPGQVIYGFALRMDGPATTPYGNGQDQSFSRFDVRVGVAAANLGSNLAANFTSTPVTVRTGPWDIAAGDFDVAPPGPAPFCPTIRFDTPYVYTGGDLLIEVRSATPSVALGIDSCAFPQTDGESTFAVGDADATTATLQVFPHNWAMQLLVSKP